MISQLLSLLVLLLISKGEAAQSFGVSLKGIHLGFQRETTVFTRTCEKGEGVCALQHWWSGGTFARGIMFIFSRASHLCLSF